MIEGLEELKKQFIVEDDIELDELKQLILRISKFCKVDKNGYVIVHNDKIRIIDKILLVLSARFLGNRLQQKLGEEVAIHEEINNKEIATMLKEKQTVVNARLKDLKDDRKIILVRRGVYKVLPHIIYNLLDRLEKEVKNE